MKDWNNIISNNIVKYRKMAKLTQSELAEKLSFSDKSVSKWERGEAIPDVTVLIAMSEIFGITLNDIVSEVFVQPKSYNVKKQNQLMIALISTGLAWLVATLLFVGFMILVPSMPSKWLCFIYAVPVSAIILLIFSTLWGKNWYKFIFISIIIWSVIVSICLSINIGWHLLYVGIPLQVLTIMWFLLVNDAWKEKFFFNVKNRIKKDKNVTTKDKNIIN